MMYVPEAKANIVDSRRSEARLSRKSVQKPLTKSGNLPQIPKAYE